MSAPTPRRNRSERGHTGALTFLELRIEELVLEGFDPRDRHGIRDAVEQELARLFAQRGSPRSIAQPLEIERLSSAFHITPDSSAQSTGTQVARAVFGQLESAGRGTGRLVRGLRPKGQVERLRKG